MAARPGTRGWRRRVVPLAAPRSLTSPAFGRDAAVALGARKRAHGRQPIRPPAKPDGIPTEGAPLIRRLILAALVAAFVVSAPATASAHHAQRPSCARTYTVHTYRLTIARIYHYRRAVLAHELEHLRTMRSCPANPADGPAAMRTITRHQARARRHRKALAAQGCGSPACNRRLGHRMTLLRYGPQAWPCVTFVITRESGWNLTARNSSSGAFGLPQALPGGKMASAGADWQTNPRTQLRWFFGYVDGRYGGPCGAAAHSRSSGWY